MKGQEWTRAVVGHLLVLKRQGYAFGRAWGDTMLLYPPDSRAHSRDTDRISHYVFFRDACEDAWFGRKPKLRYFSLGMAEDAHGPASDAYAVKRRRSKVA